MTLENAKVLYAHKLAIGKPVDDILKRYPELKEADKVVVEAPIEPTIPKGKKKHGNRSI